jgi:hypothetical protein
MVLVEINNDKNDSLQETVKEKVKEKLERIKEDKEKRLTKKFKSHATLNVDSFFNSAREFTSNNLKPISAPDHQYFDIEMDKNVKSGFKRIAIKKISSVAFTNKEKNESFSNKLSESDYLDWYYNEYLMKGLGKYSNYIGNPHLKSLLAVGYYYIDTKFE